MHKKRWIMDHFQKIIFHFSWHESSGRNIINATLPSWKEGIVTQEHYWQPQKRQQEIKSSIRADWKLYCKLRSLVLMAFTIWLHRELWLSGHGDTLGDCYAKKLWLWMCEVCAIQNWMSRSVNCSYRCILSWSKIVSSVRTQKTGKYLSSHGC